MKKIIILIILIFPFQSISSEFKGAQDLVFQSEGLDMVNKIIAVNSRCFAVFSAIAGYSKDNSSDGVKAEKLSKEFLLLNVFVHFNSKHKVRVR